MGIQQDQGVRSRWVVINTHPHSEHLAIQNLQRQEFQAYCPMISRRRSHARRVETVLRPLFPGYLFVEADAQMERWQPILSTYGVRSIVRAGNELSFIDGAFIAGLRAREMNGSITRPANPYQVGQHVQIMSGPFDNVIATIIEMDEKDRLVVLLDMMNRGIKVKVHSHQVSPVLM